MARTPAVSSRCGVRNFSTTSTTAPPSRGAAEKYEAFYRRFSPALEREFRFDRIRGRDRLSKAEAAAEAEARAQDPRLARFGAAMYARLNPSIPPPQTTMSFEELGSAAERITYENLNIVI